MKVGCYSYSITFSLQLLFFYCQLFFLVCCESSLLRLVEAPKDVKLDLLSGTSIRLSWSAVEDASSYTLAIQPEPSMKNELTVSTNYAFVDGLSIGQEYVIRVSAAVRGIQTPFSSEIKVTPSGAPLIAPAPRIVSFDETSVTLTRHRMRHYHNGNEMTKVFVRVVEEEGESRELEFPVVFPFLTNV